MTLQKLDYTLTVCKLPSAADADLGAGFFFLERTDEEVSLVCETSAVQPNVTERDDGWRALRIQGTLDFSLIGILSKLTAVLAENGIGIFAVSTFNTDYILVKAETFGGAVRALAAAGYEIQ